MSGDGANPLRHVMTLREAMDRLLEDSFVRPTQGGRAGQFPIDLADRGDRFVLRASLPGVSPDAVQVQIQGETLSIRGDVHSEVETGRWIVHEHTDVSLERVITLPSAVRAEEAEAQYENGILMLTLPKVVRAAPRQISIGRREATGTGGVDQPVSPRNPSLVDPTKPERAGANLTMNDGRTGDQSPPDSVTEESEGSFPASDPPSFTPERA